SIIFGTVLGGALVNPRISSALLAFDIPGVDLIDSGSEASLAVIMGLYIVAMLCNKKIPDTGARYHDQERNPFRLLVDFSSCFTILWKDKLGQISLAVTTLFWGAGATLQFIVLKWAEKSLQMPLDKAAVLQGIFAIGVAVGAAAAARFVPLKKSLTVMPLGIAMGLTVMTMTLVHTVWLAYPLLVFVGALSGYFVVPMNALLQHRGHVLMSAGHSIAVQNFNENLSVLTMLMLYALMVKLNLNVNLVIVMFGLFVSGSMLLAMRRHAYNQREHDSLSLIGEPKH
ncbi:MAG TPA: lysophospholipid transporter LplT, partial [Noviherbaspirillum sp.]